MPPGTPQPGRGGQGPGQGQGQQGQQRRGPRRQQSRYSVQLEEKQNLKKTFGVREQQLKIYYKEAKRSKEETGPQLVQLMERRLDNALYRSGFAVNRAQARQMASHRLMEVNGRPVDIPSLRLNVGDVVSVKENKRKKSYFTNFTKRMQNVSQSNWLELDVKNFAFKVVAAPTDKDAKLGVDIQSIVELLSR